MGPRPDSGNRPLADRGGPTVPAWWRDAKLGIFIHWTPASVPGWAPTEHEIGPLLASDRHNPLAEIPYTEWYENSLRFPNSSVSRHHAEVYPNRPYADFAADFQAGLDTWDPQDWARRFRAAGARYLVLVAKHHDGFCLWPTAVPNPHRANWCTERDVVGELGEAARGEGLRFGVYYSGGLDWTFNDHPIGSPSDLFAAVPDGSYAAYADAHVRELIDRFRPDVLWGDIAWPGNRKALTNLVAHYRAVVPDGVVNDRFMPHSVLSGALKNRAAAVLINGGARRMAQRDRGIVPPKPPIFDTRSPEYSAIDRVSHTAWESVRGIDRSFGFNRNSDPAHFLTKDQLSWSFCDVVSKGGNLLLNVGPRGADGRIPDPQLTRLHWLAELLDTDADGIVGSRPWVTPGDRGGGREVRYWADRGNVTVAIHHPGPTGSLELWDLAATAATRVRALGRGEAHSTATATTGPLTIHWQGGGDGPVALFSVSGAVAARSGLHPERAVW
ncbi:MAG: alpha-L-fucosidase [Candidatus Microthrix sp.]|nr:alpha-L-fucosidase [Candidatus Microthrix sp.]MBK7321810.1 alpha-L-fucosidase [Candidatus Microthrix sp.]